MVPTYPIGRYATVLQDNLSLCVLSTCTGARGLHLTVCSLAQMTIIDLQAMAMALACCWVPPLKKMNRHKPPPCTCSFAGLALMASAALALQILHICLMLFLCLRPWFTGGNGSARLVSNCNCTIGIHNVCLETVVLGFIGMSLSL